MTNPNVGMGRIIKSDKTDLHYHPQYPNTAGDNVVRHVDLFLTGTERYVVSQSDGKFTRKLEAEVTV